MFSSEIENASASDPILNGSDVFQITPLGAFDGRPVSLFVALSPVVGHYPEGYELIFSLVVAWNETDELAYYDGLETKSIIPDRRHRTMIRRLLRVSVGQLIDVVKPQRVSMTTYSAKLPAVALRKFDDLLVEFDARGYRAGPADSYYGRQVWMMERLTGEPA